MKHPVETLKDGPVTVVTLYRPHVRNAVDQATALALYAAFLSFEADPNARVAVFHGAQGHFCAGWDLQAGAGLARQSGEATADSTPATSLAQILDFSEVDMHVGGGPPGPMGPTRLMLSKPTVAAVSGAAVAGGMELALWCDMRVMEDAFMGVYCRRFGVPLIDGGTVRLPRIVGMGRAMDLILTGRKVEANEALAMGLCNRVVPSGEGLRAALELAHQIAGFPQATLRADRASAYEQADLEFTKALHREWERGKACISDGLKGAQQFVQGAGRHGTFK